jgi:hypothetical protein
MISVFIVDKNPSFLIKQVSELNSWCNVFIRVFPDTDKCKEASQAGNPQCVLVNEDSPEIDLVLKHFAGSDSKIILLTNRNEMRSYSNGRILSVNKLNVLKEITGIFYPETIVS